MQISNSSLLYSVHAGCYAQGQCSRKCCYLYVRIPADLSCNPRGSPRTVVLQCTVYAPSAAIGRVRWYSSESEGLAGIVGELVGVIGLDSCFRIPLMNSSITYRGLTQMGCNMAIRNFTSRDNGYYWCQVEVNNTCLLPSPSGHVEFNATHSSDCKSENIAGSSLFSSGGLPICATSSSSRCPASLQPAPPTINITTATTIPPSSPLLPTATPCSSDATPEGDSNSTMWYGIIGVLVFITSILSAALTLLVVVGLSQRRAMRIKSNGNKIGW